MSSAKPPADFSNFLDALDTHGKAYDVQDASEPRDGRTTVSDVRRRRGRLAVDRDPGHRDVMLVERDGVLLWQTASDLMGARSGSLRRGGRRGWRRGLEGANLLKEVSVPVLEPNEHMAALRDTDERLNAQWNGGLRLVRRNPADANGFELTDIGLTPTFAGRTLVLIHGTFASSAGMLGEFSGTPAGRKFLADALTRYNGQVLMFDHPTLSVSPVLNAIDLSRRMAGTTGQLDVIAHSRGGLVAQWWLEVFGDGLAGATVTAVFAGSPLNGTSLASPNRIRPLLSVLSNIGHFLDKSLGIAAATNPFTLASFALLRFLGRRESDRWGLPPVDLGDRRGVHTAVAVIPGLQGQSAVRNNFELDRLRKSLARPNVRYCALTADFEPERMGWSLWKVISEFGDRTKDGLTDHIFGGPNDLVVDQAHMTTLATGRDIADVHAFATGTTVHHCNYFRQPETITTLRKWLAVP